MYTLKYFSQPFVAGRTDGRPGQLEFGRVRGQRSLPPTSGLQTQGWPLYFFLGFCLLFNQAERNAGYTGKGSTMMDAM